MKERREERRGMVSMREMEVRCDNSRKGEKGEKMKKKWKGSVLRKRKKENRRVSSLTELILNYSL
jgi:hypothetical protein